MEQEVKKDYIIVGQGIAGTVLAQTLLKQGKSIIVIDKANLSKASKIAAGLYNPVVFKRLVKSWLADDLVPFMDTFYTDSEALLNEKFYFKKKIIRLFAEEQERDLWLKKTNEPVGKYLSKDVDETFLNDVIFNPLGAAEVIKAGNLDTVKFLDGFRAYFQQHDSLLDEAFDYKQLIIAEKGVTYKNYQASKIIFCEGYKTTENPYLSWLPFKLTKGETVTIQLEKDGSEELIPFDKVINKGSFILPIGNNTFKVGATYEWKDLTENTTEKGKEDLVNKLKKVLKVPFKIIKHQAGIRPTVNDRRPLLGLHPEHPSLAVFNGLGTKGIMLAPYFANHFVDFLEHGIALDKEVDVKRCKYPNEGS